MDRALQGLKNAPEWNIEDELLKCEGESRVQAFAQPMSTAVQVALVDVLRDWGIIPTSVVGHSSGEIAASYASGAIPAEVAITIAYFRGQAFHARSSNRPGAMAAVSLSPERAKTYLNHEVTIACENSPQNVTLQTHGTSQIQPFIRSVQSEDWYSALNKRGLEYGQAFRGLKKITACPSTLQATAVLQDEQHHTSYYSLHPVLIDQCLQLLSVAATQDISRRMTRLYIPTSIESLFISPGRGPMSLSVGCEMSGTMNGNAILISNDGVVLSMRKGLFFSVPDSGIDEIQVPLASTLHWKPDIDFFPPEHQFPHIYKTRHLDHLWFVLARLLIVETYHQTRFSNPTSEHLKKKYLVFIESQYEEICSASPNLLPEMRDFNASDPQSRRSQIEQIVAMRPDCDDDDSWPRASKPFKLVLDRIGDILQGNVNPLELLMEDNVLRDFYGSLSVRMHWDGFLSLLSHSNPTLRVLEIGAGTSATTAMVLKGLASGHKGRMYTKYTSTDISPGFLPDAKDQFKDHQEIEYTTLDISQDPMKQGFQPESYDLVIASNVLHATPSISETLSNVRRLVAPGGHFLLHEICNFCPFIDYIMGLFPGWWIGEQDGRKYRPYISTEWWHDELLEAGFTGNDMVRLDGDDSYYITASILSRPQPKELSRGDLYILYRGTISQWARNLEKLLTLDAMLFIGVPSSKCRLRARMSYH